MSLPRSRLPAPCSAERASVVMGESGRVLWRHHFDALLWEPSVEDLVWKIQIVDLDGDGVPEVLAAVSFGGPGADGREEVYCFSSRGRVLWHYKPVVDIAFNTRDLNGPWRFTDMLVVPGNPSAPIWVAVTHNLWWPAFIMRLSSKGVPSRVFTSSGHIYSLRRVQTKAGSYMLAAGINNEYRQASLAILTENGPPNDLATDRKLRVSLHPQLPSHETLQIRSATAF